jgi:hypothetical protein
MVKRYRKPPMQEEAAKLMQSFAKWAALGSYFARLARICDDRAIAVLKRAKGIE